MTAYQLEVTVTLALGLTSELKEAKLSLALFDILTVYGNVILTLASFVKDT